MYEIITRCWMYLSEIGSTRLQTLAIDGEVVSSNYIPNNGIGWIIASDISILKRVHTLLK